LSCLSAIIMRLFAGSILGILFFVVSIFLLIDSSANAIISTTLATLIPILAGSISGWLLIDLISNYRWKHKWLEQATGEIQINDYERKKYIIRGMREILGPLTSPGKISSRLLRFITEWIKTLLRGEEDEELLNYLIKLSDEVPDETDDEPELIEKFLLLKSKILKVGISETIDTNDIEISDDVDKEKVAGLEAEFDNTVRNILHKTIRVIFKFFIHLKSNLSKVKFVNINDLFRLLSWIKIQISLLKNRKQLLISTIITVMLVVIISTIYRVNTNRYGSESGGLSQPGIVQSEKPYTIQIAAHLSIEKAVNQIKVLRKNAVNAYLVQPEAEKSRYYRIRIGHFDGVSVAKSFADSLKDAGVIDEYFVSHFTVGEIPAGIDR